MLKDTSLIRPCRGENYSITLRETTPVLTNKVYNILPEWFTVGCSLFLLRPNTFEACQVKFHIHFVFMV